MRPKRLAPYGAPQLKDGKEYKLPDDDEAFFQKALELNLPCKFASTNPKRPGSKSYDRWEIYCKAKTLAEALEYDPSDGMNDMKYAYCRGHITFPGYEFSEANTISQECEAYPFFNDIIRDFYPENDMPDFLNSDDETMKFAIEQAQRIHDVGHGADINIVQSRDYERKIKEQDTQPKSVGAATKKC